MNALIELQYLPTIPYFIVLANSDRFTIERCENWVKSTFRNRSLLASPNGVLAISEPVEGGKDKRRKVEEVRFYADFDWKKRHWQSICSCYRSSPYFEYYEDEFESIFMTEEPKLFKFNLLLLNWLIEKIGITTEINFTDQFVAKPEGVTDLRSCIHPNEKKATLPAQICSLSYQQVFQNKTGFLENMSIIDLLFSRGPETLTLLNSAWKK